MSIDPDLKASIAATRFGLGARPDEIAATRPDPVAYLKAQIRPQGADQPAGQFKTSVESFDGLRQLQMQKRQAKLDGDALDPVKEAQRLIRQGAGGEFIARAALASETEAAFRERWALFWFNHFTVGQKNLQTVILVGPFEREAIRPHVFGRFEDLLVASSSHPAMLIYLDQIQSIGPNSQYAALGRAGLPRLKGLGGLNENLGREIMELHTLGVGSGYTQADVTEFARALTGWSIVGFKERADLFGQPGQFTFRQGAHEPGVRHILGKAYPQTGIDQAHAVLTDLAANPATAHHIAFKLARHFVADDPPPALVARLENTFNSTGGQLDKVAETLIESPEAWTPQEDKFKTPYEFLISSYRAAGMSAGPEIAPVLNGLGQKPFSAPSPKGWAEDAQDWASPDGIVKRMGWAENFSARAVPADAQPMQIAQNTLGARLTLATATAIGRAESRKEAFSIMLMSPEFQRR